VSKAATRGIDNARSNNLTILREIPTRISPLSAGAVVVIHHDDNDARQQQTLSSLPTAKAETQSSQRSSSSKVVGPFDDNAELDAIIARCAWLQQQWSTPIASIDPNGAAQIDAQHLVIPDTSSPRNSAPLASVDATEPILTNYQHLLDNMRQQSTTISNLAAMSDELVAIMTRVASVIDNLCSAQPPRIVPSPNPMATIKSTTISIPAPAPKITKLTLPSTPQPATKDPRTADSPWLPPPPEPHMKTVPKMKPPVRKKRLKAKPSVIRGRPGPSRTKDNLCPP